MPLRAMAKRVKLFEIGLGCTMRYGPGASVKLWQALLPGAELWEADHDDACVAKAKADGLLSGVNVLTGDQADAATVQRWASESGGNFDVVIDDGGHSNKMIKTSFDALWPHVVPGGLYFIEDLQLGRKPLTRRGEGDDTKGKAVMADFIEGWVEHLLIHPKQAPHPLPAGVAFIFCQSQACVIGKQTKMQLAASAAAASRRRKKR